MVNKLQDQMSPGAPSQVGAEVNFLQLPVYLLLLPVLVNRLSCREN